MSLGFRKSFGIVPGVRVNLSRQGASVSGGPRGAKVSVNTRRQRRMSLGLFGFFFRRRV